MNQGENAAIVLSPNRDKRRTIFMLRGMVIVAVGGLLIASGVGRWGFGGLALVMAFAVSDLLLLRVPLRRVGNRRFELVLGATDLVLLALGVLLAGAGRGALPVSLLLMALVIGVGSRKSYTVAGAAAVGATHAWLVLAFGSRAAAAPGQQLVLQTLFLCSAGLYYAFLTEGAHSARRREDAEASDRQELSTLLEILDAVTSSLDLRTVTGHIVRRLNEIVPSVRCSILYIDEAMSLCRVIASHDDPRLPILELDLRKYPEIREAIRTRQPVIVQDVIHHPLMHEVVESIRGLDFQSIVVIPLTFGDDVLGTLCLKTARTGDYSEREIRFCTAVARASANALKNAILHEKVSEESARRKRTGEKLGRILNHSPDLIVTTDVEGRITEFNRGAERLLGFRKNEAMGLRVTMLLDDEKDHGLVAETLERGSLPSRVVRMGRKGGATVDTEAHLCVLKDECGETTGTLWIGRDVTELRATQLQLLQSEKLSTIGEVISGVAHELNNPLSGVLGFSQLLMARHHDGPLARELERINESAQRCHKIVKNLLSFARAQKPERKYLGVNGIIEKTLELRRYQLRVNNIEVIKELDPALPRTMLDFHHIQQVLLNLINNAQHAMCAVPDRPGELRVRTLHANGSIRIEVADNGTGVRPEIRDKIFDPFFTTKAEGEGTGLGLSVSYGIIREHGGRIRVDSRDGEGSTFVIELPIVREREARADEQETAAAEQTDAVRPARILVVDDEPAILDLLIEVLEQAGHRVDTADNGQEARRKVQAGEYDLVLTDVRMPQMDGVELYRTVLAASPSLRDRVIFMTGDLIDSNTTSFLAELNVPTLAKPMDLGQLHETVRRLLADEPSAG